MRSLIIMFALLSLQPAHADDLYRWVDKQGKVHYGDIPEEEADRLNLNVYGTPSASAVEDASLPYATRRAKENFPVTMYVTEYCGDLCKRAHDFLSKRHVPFTEKMLKTQAEIDAFEKLSGSNDIPTLSVGKDWLKGFHSQQWQDELDAVGYPK
jgi:glutaredoxin